jgi:hypothetical protein
MPKTKKSSEKSIQRHQFKNYFHIQTLKNKKNHNPKINLTPPISKNLRNSNAKNKKVIRKINSTPSISKKQSITNKPTKRTFKIGKLQKINPMAKNSQNLSKICSKSINSRNQVQPQIQQIKNQQKTKTNPQTRKRSTPSSTPNKTRQPASLQTTKCIDTYWRSNLFIPLFASGSRLSSARAKVTRDQLCVRA